MTENFRFTVYFTSWVASGGRRGHDRALQSVRDKHQFAVQLIKADNLKMPLQYFMECEKSPERLTRPSGDFSEKKRGKKMKKNKNHLLQGHYTRKVLIKLVWFY